MCLCVGFLEELVRFGYRRGKLGEQWFLVGGAMTNVSLSIRGLFVPNDWFSLCDGKTGSNG